MASKEDRKVPNERMWTLLNPTTRMVKFQYSASRATIHAIEMLGDYRGLLMADAYIAYRQLVRLSPGAIILLSCWAHARRRILVVRDRKTDQRPLAGRKEEASKTKCENTPFTESIPGAGHRLIDPDGCREDRHPVYPQSLGSPVGIRGIETWDY